MNIFAKIMAGLNVIGEIVQLAVDIKNGNTPNTAGLAGELYDISQKLGLKLKNATKAEFMDAVDALVNLFY